jgi:dTDP-4-amino-4,6-dideoxygalactose transaminase
MHYGGLPCDMTELRTIADERGIPIIEDAAHAMGATYQGAPIGSLSEFTIYSFLAVKHITTGDGGMISLKDTSLVEKAKRLRWFGIDRGAKQSGTWENDIREVGYKYQMTDIGAALGLAGLEDFDELLAYRQKLFHHYERGLTGIPGIEFIGGGYTDREHAAWIVTIRVESNRLDLQKKLFENGIESNQVHYRNDRYSVFGGRRDNLPNMDAIETQYLVLPIHHKVRVEDVTRICDLIRSGW